MNFLDITIPIIGFLVGIFSALFGVGGGVIIVPVLSVMLNFPMPEAVATSLGQMVFTSLSGSIKHFLLKNIDFKAASLAIPFTILGAYFSAHQISILYKMGYKILITKLIAAILIATFLLVAYRFIKQIKIKDNSSQQPTLFNYIITPFISFTIGNLSGIAGMGGGVLLVPMYIYVLKLPTSRAIGTSSFNVIFSAIIGASVYLHSGFINVKYVILIAAGSIIGAQIGATLTKKLPEQKLKRYFGIFILFMAFVIFYKFFIAFKK